MCAFRVNNGLAAVDTTDLGQHNDDHPSSDSDRHRTNVPQNLMFAADSEAVKMDWVHAIKLGARILRECYQPRHSGPATHLFGSAATFPVSLPSMNSWVRPRMLSKTEVASRWGFKVSVFSCSSTEFIAAGGEIAAPEDLDEVFRAKRAKAAEEAAAAEAMNPFGKAEDDASNEEEPIHEFKEVNVHWQLEDTLVAWSCQEPPQAGTAGSDSHSRLQLCAMPSAAPVESPPSHANAAKCFVLGLSHTKVYRFAAHSCEVPPPPATADFMQDCSTPPFR